MYQTGGTLKETIRLVGKKQYVLPAIQREFVWKPEQICKLFDSIMQGYPFGTFLLWMVNTENTGKYKFYEFMRHYHERDNAHCKPLEDTPTGSLTAVLDGQQRLTALNIGLRGSLTLKLRNRWWNNPNAFPKKHLHLNLLKSGEPDEEGIRYEFSFLTEDRAKEITGDECWFRVPDILEIDDAPAMLEWVNSRLPQDQTNQAFKVLNQLYQVVHNRVLVAYYEEKSQDLEKVLNIFIRTNSGGTVLSYSDLLLSIAVAQWSKHDARDEIHALVDQLNDIGQGFAFSKDLVLKAGLMLSDIGNVGFKVENFNRENMEILEAKWSGVKDALLLTTQLISSFGFSDQTFRADSAILPIAYYLHQLAPGDGYLTHAKYQKDREAIRDWFIRSLLKASGIWGSGLDTLLTALRDVIKEDGAGAFPQARIHDVMARRGKSLNFEAEEIEELADMAYGDRRLFALLTLIFPFVSAGYNFHIDHVFPKSAFNKRKLERNGVSGEQIDKFKSNSERLGNLQLLLGAINNEKRKTMPAAWLSTQFPDANKRRAEMEAHMLGEVPTGIGNFGLFYEVRREVLRVKIGNILKSPGDREAS